MQAKELRFAKYTSFGNTFVVVDETVTPLADDVERAGFARWVLDGAFGVGGTDNVLYLTPADGPDADWVFRIFEVDGTETLSCGNGLLSTAAALHRTTGGTRFGVLTELPTGRPRRVEVGITGDGQRTWLNVGWPRAVPTDLFRRPGPAPTDGIDPVTDLDVALPDAEWARGLPRTVRLSGSLVFTGEPHLVLPLGHGVPEVLAERIFPDLGDARGRDLIGRPPTTAMRHSNALVDHLGREVNRAYRHLFPQGVHLNFALVRDRAGLIEYRTWERAINCETLACGSGAVAMAYVAGRHGLVDGDVTELHPHRCRWYQPDARLTVTRTPDGFVLTGQPRLVCAGVAAYPVATELVGASRR